MTTTAITIAEVAGWASGSQNEDSHYIASCACQDWTGPSPSRLRQLLEGHTCWIDGAPMLDEPWTVRLAIACAPGTSLRAVWEAKEGPAADAVPEGTTCEDGCVKGIVTIISTQSQVMSGETAGHMAVVRAATDTETDRTLAIEALARERRLLLTLLRAELSWGQTRRDAYRPLRITAGSLDQLEEIVLQPPGASWFPPRDRLLIDEANDLVWTLSYSAAPTVTRNYRDYIAQSFPLTRSRRRLLDQMRKLGG